MGQGIGNMVSGLFGGVPGAGATMGTVTNIRSGGRTQVSGALRQTFLDPEGEEADPFAARVGLVALRGSFTVASSTKLVAVIGGDIKDHEVVIFDFSGATYLDDSAAMLIRQLIEVAGKEETECVIIGLSGSVEQTLLTLDVLRDVPGDRVVESLDEARQVARNLLDD